MVGDISYINGKGDSACELPTLTAIVYADPIIVETELFERRFYLSDRATSASIPIENNQPDQNPMLRYRASRGPALGNQFLCHSLEPIYAAVSRSAVTTSTVYEYKLVARNLIDGAYEFGSGIDSFTTESKYIIPKIASFELGRIYCKKTMLGNKER